MGHESAGSIVNLSVLFMPGSREDADSSYQIAKRDRAVTGAEVVSVLVTPEKRACPSLRHDVGRGGEVAPVPWDIPADMVGIWW